MTVADPADAEIAALLRRARVIGVVGASADPSRPSHAVMMFLRRQGYRVVAVNPALAGRRIDGIPVVADLAASPVPVDLVDIFRRADAVAAVVDQAIALGTARTVWMQLGIRDEAAALRARAAGLAVVMDRCPVIEFRRLGGDRSWSGAAEAAETPHTPCSRTPGQV